MNQSEWKKSGKFPGKYEWYNKTRKIQKSLQYNSDEKANRIHHLRDTEGQRKYNDEHYELWGFNEDGTFEYGKYVIFVTEEWHNNYHAQSEETNNKRSTTLKKHPPMKGKHLSQETKDRLSKINTGKHHTEETCKIISECSKRQWQNGESRQRIMANKPRGKNHPFYGKHLTDEHRQHLSDSHKGIKLSDKTKQLMSESRKGEKNYNYGKHLSQETKDKLSNSCRKSSLEKIAPVKAAYAEYKSNGGTLQWNDFQKYYKSVNSN